MHWLDHYNIRSGRWGTLHLGIKRDRVKCMTMLLASAATSIHLAQAGLTKALTLKQDAIYSLRSLVGRWQVSWVSHCFVSSSAMSLRRP